VKLNTFGDAAKSYMHSGSLYLWVSEGDIRVRYCRAVGYLWIVLQRGYLIFRERVP